MTPAALLLFALAAPLPAQEDAAPSGEEQAPAAAIEETDAPVEIDDSVSDERLRDFILDALTNLDWVQNPTVEVRGRVVKLGGVAASKTFQEKAGAFARRVKPVIAVQNDITVDRAFSPERAWTQIRASVRDLWDDFLERCPLLLVALAVLLFTAVVAKIARFVFRRTPGYGRLRGSLQDLIQQVVTVGVWIVGALIAATVAFPGVTPGSLIATLGLGGVAIGFAFKDIFENFLAGVFILWKFPFDRGDFIECEGVAGKIQQITIRNTLVRQPDGVLVVCPNAQLFKNPVDVLTSWKSRRITIVCGVAYDEDVDAARGVIEGAVKGCDSVEGRKPVEVFADEFADSSINYKVSWWADPTPLGERKSRDQVVAAVKAALDGAGIEIPFPYRTLTFKEPLKTERLGENGAGERGS